MVSLVGFIINSNWLKLNTIIYRLLQQMKARLLYLLFGTGIGSGAHYGYRYYNPERNLSQSTNDMVNSYVGNHELEQGYLVSVLKSVGLMLKGFYHYGMDTKIRGFNYNSTYLKKSEVKNQNSDITHLYCIFSPTQYICGHPEIQHGGATATIIDQNMGYLAILNSKQMVATADLHVKYKKPIKKDQCYVLQTKVTDRKGKKIWVKGTIKQLETGEIKVESEALFITVNWDNQMSRILTKFFQVINFKDYAEEHGHQTFQDYTSASKQSLLPVSVQNIISQQKVKQSQKIDQNKSQILQRKLVNDLKNKQLDEKIRKLEQVISKLQKKQNLVVIPAADQSQVYREGISKNQEKPNLESA